MRIAIIGTGISGLGAAWLLHRQHEITVYEKADRLGGHANTVTVDYDGTELAVDTGFIVYNRDNYPNLTALFEHLGVATEISNMSFSVSMMKGQMEWCGDNLRSVFAAKRNFANPRFLWALKEIFRFNRTARADLHKGGLEGLSLNAYLDRRGFGTGFRRYYLLPMGAAIWSTPAEEMLDFPAESFLHFFRNHGLLEQGQNRWRTVTGGSREYVHRLAAPFRDRIHLGTGARAIRRDADGVRIWGTDGREARYDRVILACHSDEALALLTDLDTEERAILGAMRYTPNTAYLHRDARLMPARKAAWASWNYRAEGWSETSVQVTYWMNRLQNLDPAHPLFVSLNPERAPDPARTFARFDYAHPLFDRASLEAKAHIPRIQGVRNTWFAGAYLGYGFHEDGLASGLSAAEAAGGVCRPWRSAPASTASAPLPLAAE